MGVYRLAINRHIYMYMCMRVHYESYCLARQVGCAFQGNGLHNED